MRARHRGSRRIVAAGKRYWRKQVTASGGGFRKCVAQVEAHTPMRGRTARGYCANRIHETTGRWPGRRR